MVDLEAVARRFISVQMRERDDIIGAYVGGSAARGTATEVSDVDVTLVVEEAGGHRVKIGGWEEGVFIDAGYKPREALASIDRVMDDHVGATILRDALIVHDPTGLLTDLQTEVRAVFMQPARVQARVNYGLEFAKRHVAELGEASAREDRLAICKHLWPVLWGAILVPLLRLGVAPSATRIMAQLGEINPALHDQFVKIEGSDRMEPRDVLVLVPAFSEIALRASLWGRQAQYAVGKAKWMAERGQHREAFHVMCTWSLCAIDACRASEGDQAVPFLSEQARRWLQAMGWNGSEALAQRTRLIVSLMEEVERLASSLPSPGTESASSHDGRSIT